MKRFALLAALCATVAVAASAPSATPPATPPVARVAIVTDTYHGQSIDDPYRWMEDAGTPEFQAWMRAQADYAATKLAALPGRAAILAELEGLSTAAVQVSDLRMRAGKVFYLRRGTNDQDAMLYVRDRIDGPERLLVDPNAGVTDGTRWSLADFSPSPDGERVTYLVAPGGSEQAELRIVDVRTGSDGGLRIPRTNFSPGLWLPDRSGFFYVQFPESAAGAAAAGEYQKMRTYLHRLGTPVSEDRAVFGYGLDPALPDGIDMIWSVEAQPQWNGLALAQMQTGISPDKAWWAAPLSAVTAGGLATWRPLVAMTDQVTDIAVHGDTLYALTSRGAPRYRIVRTSLAAPDLAAATEVFPQTDAVVTALVAQADALYVQTLDTGTYRIWRVDHATGERREVAPPFPGATTLGHQEPGGTGLSFNAVSWNRSRTHYLLDADGAATPTGLVPPHPVSLADVEFVDAEATSHDGTKVPLVIIHRRGHVRDGRAPTLVDAYGAYGIENVSPVFDPRVLPWVQRGGVFVWAGVRGGGERGEAWHLAGQKATKPNTWKDAIAVAEYLVEQNWTAPAHLAVHGASAGGLLVSNAITERPTLFRAALLSVGMTNAIRSETTANGLPNVPEFGSVADEAGFRALLAMDGYHKVRAGTPYPAVLIDTGINDPRVDPWMSAKMAARLQAATSSGHPVWLRVDYDAGHGKGSTRRQRDELLADQYAFLLAQLRAAPGVDADPPTSAQ